MTYIRRWAESEFQMAERIFKAVIFSGVRQCGKTTLMRELLPKDAAYVSLDREIFRQAAADAPGGFLQQYRNRSCLAIDEVQKVPALFHEIKAFVDESRELRQYLLSGSSNYKTMPSIHESMAGRLGEVRLRPMTEGEIQEQPPRFIDRLFNEEFDDKLTAEDCSKRVIIEKALRGGFPDVLRMPLSIFDISSTSFISRSKCLLETLILLKQPLTFSGSNKLALAIAVIPIMAFIGVRISCDIDDRKLLLARLATCSD